MKKYLYTLSIGLGLALFGTGIALGDDASYHRRRPIGAGCWWVRDYDSRTWSIDCGTLPEIEVVAATPPDDEDIYHHVGSPWWHVDLFGKPYRWDPTASLWESIPASAMPLEVFIELAPGQSTTIDCAPTGHSDIRKRDLVVWTEPPFNDLQITSITTTRKATPHYGHHHPPDNSKELCRGDTSVDDGVTDSNGEFEFFYRGPEAAGRTVVTVSWLDLEKNKTGSVSMTFENRHDGLVEITGGTGIFLTGQDAYHRAGDIHWVTPTTKTRIASLAKLYYAEYNENLKVNDGSLRYGGLYDFNENWDTPHSTHRDGKNVDIKPMTNSGSNDPKWDFLRVRIRRLGSTFYDEVNTNAPHLHFIQ